MAKNTLALCLAGLLMVGCSPNNGGGGGGAGIPMTPKKLAQQVKDSIKNPSNPIVSVECSTDTPDTPDRNGVGTYKCEEQYESGLGYNDYKVAPDGSWSKVAGT